MTRRRYPYDFRGIAELNEIVTYFDAIDAELAKAKAGQGGTAAPWTPASPALVTPGKPPK